MNEKHDRSELPPDAYWVDTNTDAVADKLWLENFQHSEHHFRIYNTYESWFKVDHPDNRILFGVLEIDQASMIEARRGIFYPSPSMLGNLGCRTPETSEVAVSHRRPLEHYSSIGTGFDLFPFGSDDGFQIRAVEINQENIQWRTVEKLPRIIRCDQCKTIIHSQSANECSECGHVLAQQTSAHCPKPSNPCGQNYVCPDCATEFLCFEDKGICPYCDLMFSVDDAGEVTRWIHRLYSDTTPGPLGYFVTRIKRLVRFVAKGTIYDYEMFSELLRLYGDMPSELWEECACLLDKSTVVQFCSYLDSKLLPVDFEPHPWGRLLTYSESAVEQEKKKWKPKYIAIHEFWHNHMRRRKTSVEPGRLRDHDSFGDLTP